jgi:hypothetical protein
MSYEAQINEQRRQKQLFFFSGHPNSPIDTKKSKLKKLDFFPVDQSYRVQGEAIPLEDVSCAHRTRSDSPH